MVGLCCHKNTNDLIYVDSRFFIHLSRIKGYYNIQENIWYTQTHIFRLIPIQYLSLAPTHRYFPDRFIKANILKANFLYLSLFPSSSPLIHICICNPINQSINTWITIDKFSLSDYLSFLNLPKSILAHILTYICKISLSFSRSLYFL